MSWFKDKKEENENQEDFNYDPTNPYTLQVEDDFVEVNIKELLNANKSSDESKLSPEQ